MTCRLDESKLKLLVKQGKKGLRHNTGSKRTLFPYTTQTGGRATFKNGFQAVTGDFTRRIFSVETGQEFEPAKLLSRAVDQVAYSDPRDRSELSRFLQGYIFGNSTHLQAFHPHVFLYFPLSDHPSASGERKIAKFLSEVLVEPDSKNEVLKVFEKTNSEDLLTQLVLEQLSGLKPTRKKQEYAPKLRMLSKRFTEDFLFLSRYRDYFADHYPLLLNHYYFVYVSQLVLKLDQFEQAEEDQLTKIYYLLDWEKSNKRREAHSQGFQQLMEKANKAFIHVNCLAQLCENSLGLDELLTYSELHQILMTKSEEEQQEFINSLNQWVATYCEMAGLEQPEPAENLPDGYQNLFDSIHKVIPFEAARRYGLGVQEAAAKYFMKARGRLGNTLNVQQDFLLMMTAICVKEQRLPLKRLFSAMELRGLFFDRYSKQGIIELYDNLNLLDKKSDSGDAQYVKPVL
ncbi:DNA phosphorothioation-dependent restriction protein DptG [Kroppenstedtia eburnea]|uniref:DNA phosphorothioation-dependent restriction protein DptG n=1 Tax=Kroppenstedtia eburnea TaxID=714067 RepID=UPI0036271898